MLADGSTGTRAKNLAYGFLQLVYGNLYSVVSLTNWLGEVSPSIDLEHKKVPC